MTSDREMIARGEFFTEAELRAVPSRRRLAQARGAGPRRDPNDAPPSAEAWPPRRASAAGAGSRRMSGPG